MFVLTPPEALEERLLLTTFFVDTIVDDNTGTTDGLVSLREAIIAAETNAAFGDAAAGSVDGDTIGFDASIANMTIDLVHGDLIVTDDLKINGETNSITIDALNNSRIFNVDTTELFTLSNVRLTNGSADMGGAILFKGSGNKILFNVTIDHSVANGNNSTHGGGGLFASGGDVVISQSTIHDNSATGVAGSGGGVFVDEARVTFNDSTISSNQANRAGGGIENLNGFLVLDDSTVGGANESDGNVAGPSGTANPGNGGGVHVTGMNGITLVRNTNVDNNVAASEGGGIWNDAQSSLIIREGSTLSGNQASGDGPDQGGGGIFNNAGTLRIFDSTIDNNLADGDQGAGGGIFTSGNRMVTLEQSTVDGNEASRFGGGIKVSAGGLRVIDSMVTNNVAGPSDTTGAANGGGVHFSNTTNRQFNAITNSTVSNNVASGNGGGVAVENSSQVFINTNSLVSDNQAHGDGLNQGGGGLFVTDARLSFSTSTLTNNHASGAQGMGGGVLSLDSNFQLGASTVSANSAVRAGGGIAGVGGTVFVSSKAIIGGPNIADGNIAGPVGNENPGNGGGIFLDSIDRGFIYDITVQNNTAANHGGGIWIKNPADIDVSILTISNNSASGGGGVFVEDGSLEITRSRINDNIANGTGGNGGGVLIANGDFRIGFGNTIENNIATSSGGGAGLIDGVLRVVNSTIRNNNAGIADGTGDGGGISVIGENDPILIVNQATISNNSAGNEGGGIWNNSSSQVIVRDTQIDSNSASGDQPHDGGGGIFNHGGTLRTFDTVLSNNEADGDSGTGGGIYADEGLTVLRNTTITSNSASRAGGGFALVGGRANLFDSTIGGSQNGEGNIARPSGSPNLGMGGGIFVTGDPGTQLAFVGGTIEKNIAFNQGGGIWSDTNTLVVIHSQAQILGNIARSLDSFHGGGGIYNRGGEFILRDTMVADNVAQNDGRGGGIFNALNGDMDIISADIRNNIAIGSGGGIYNAAFIDLLQGGDVTGNIAGATGGGIFTTALATTNVGSTNVSGNSPDNFN